MIHVYATAKLRKKLPLDERNLLTNSGASPKSTLQEIASNPINHWHANLIHLQRRQCVLFVHDISRFTLFVPCLTKPDFARLDWHFRDVLMNSLLKAGVPTSAIERAANFFEPLCFDHTQSRSVQGTMNQLKKDIEYKLWFERGDVRDLLPYSTSAWLSDRPCMIKGQKDCIWPIRTMTQLLTRTLLRPV